MAFFSRIGGDVRRVEENGERKKTGLRKKTATLRRMAVRYTLVELRGFEPLTS